MTITEEFEDTNSSQEDDHLPPQESVTSAPSAFLLEQQHSTTTQAPITPSERKSTTADKVNFANMKLKNSKRSLEKELHVFSHQKKKDQNQALIRLKFQNQIKQL